MKHIASLSYGKDSLAMLLKLIELKMPLHEALFFNTTKEFNAVYNLMAKMLPLFEEENIKYTELQMSQLFDYKMFDKPVCKRGTKCVHRYGYSWCGGTCRWGTTEKLQALDKYCKENNAVCYVGIAADEWKRLLGIFEFDMEEYLDSKGEIKTKAALDEKGRIKNFKQISNFHKKYPLVEWGMTEKDCLEYCYIKGYNWLEKTDSIYEVPENIDLYKVLDRVSCWCCRNKNLYELKNIYRYFTNSYWRKLKDIQSRLKEPMKQSGSIFYLEKRFAVEVQAEQIQYKYRIKEKTK